MNIAVLSGKGGTGKTFISVNLASIIDNVRYIDCDTEEPNGHIFLKPRNITSKEITVKIPKLIEERCNGCRKCVDFCKFNALAFIKGKPLVFNDICHSCGGCSIVCEKVAFEEIDKIVGYVKSGNSDGVEVVTGILNTGVASSVPIINDMISNIDKSKDTIIDCPPGSACTVMESIKKADYCVIVAEPTKFGVHNLKMVHELVKLFNKPHGVVVNKVYSEENPATQYCKDNGTKILAQILFDKEIGKIVSNGYIAVQNNESMKELFTKLYSDIKGEVEQ